MSGNLDIAKFSPARRSGPQTPKGKSRVANNGIRTGSTLSVQLAHCVLSYRDVFIVEDRKVSLCAREQHIREVGAGCSAQMECVRTAYPEAELPGADQTPDQTPDQTLTRPLPNPLPNPGANSRFQRRSGRLTYRHYRA